MCWLKAKLKHSANLERACSAKPKYTTITRYYTKTTQVRYIFCLPGSGV